MAHAPLIELEQVSLVYPGAAVPAVTDLSLSIATGSIVAFLGPSGCGKTTILRMIAGFERPSQGTVRIAGRTVASAQQWVEPEHRGVGMVFQDYALFPHLTVTQNVAFGLRHLAAQARKDTIAEVLAMVGLEEYADQYPGMLSGGQQQRVAVARALAPHPMALLLDEPFSNLDPDMTARMRDELLDILKNAGTTTILVTHDHQEAFSMADHVAVLHAGRLEQYDTPDIVYHMPTTPIVADFVGHADFLPGTVTDGTVVTEIGTFPNARQFEDGARVLVMVRPDDIQIRPSETGKAKVIRRHFRGSENLYRILLPSDQQLHSNQPSTTVYPSGTNVDVTVDAIHTVLFRHDATLPEP